jgi:ribosomal-protein-alanine N-acetyltransferase
MNDAKYYQFRELTTEHYCLRQLSTDDVNEIFILRSDKRVLEFLDLQKAETADDALKFINKILNENSKLDWFYWGITEKENRKLVGTICLWNFSGDRVQADIGFALLPDSQGKGIMQEVIPGVLKYGFNELNLNCIKGETAAKNIKSIKLMEKFGFKYEKDLNEFTVYSLEKNRYCN